LDLSPKRESRASAKIVFSTIKLLKNNSLMDALKYQTIIKNGQLDLPHLDLPEGTVVEAILLIQEPVDIDETDYLLSTEANRQHLQEAMESLKNSDRYIYIDSSKL
jgi:hypothetical protein